MITDKKITVTGIAEQGGSCIGEYLLENDNALGPALLMEHYRNVKVFIHFSSGASYTSTGNPATVYNGEDAVGSGAEDYYSGAKIAVEGAVKAMVKILNIMTIQLRLSVYCGTHGDDGLSALVYLNNLINHLTIEIIKHSYA